MLNTPNLSHGRHTLAIPGPSVMPERVLQAMHRPAPNIYTGELIDITYSCIPDLKAVAKTQGEVAMYIGNGHAAWEASLANTLAPGDRVLVPGGAQFSKGWAETARKRGLIVDELDFGRRAPIDSDAVEQALRDDKAHEIKAVLVVQVDTASSAKSDLAAIRRAMDAAVHPALLMSDSIACLGCDDMQMDNWGVDVVMTGSQKGLMVPPGMCFVFFNEKAQAARARLERVSGYWDWEPRVNPQGYYQISCGTAPTHHFYGLRVALDILVHEEGIDNVLARHATLARAVWAACDAWASGGPLEINIPDIAARSNAVTSMRIGAPYGTQLRDWVTAEAGMTLGIGLGMATEDDPNSDGFFRIGHMGHLNSHMLLGTLGSIDAGLKSLGIPHGSGALEAAAQVCAGK
ncbi:alanine-glyoxylate transaminase/serine-glyoxylate transaminase/serine-pyruvate transaminase [Litoreibacter ponti]|uniref:Alanine-glyoxylate transaminase/serine-glyoxylate transaminase/serine-pyruvate transaminase n=1 Tax=Litoreibacter ponti TaxID=1510457 RepID=A0A2T6BKZ0_9RHOB|nr:aminotransferase class V-fold PLP-dependent enzyme [Litoreibacter ponti]PTX56734.1 alanine-glyoxylate transaminase/serine-glyoxylate transaminase/serine-pyruvate transaminase [Litoreibacter ponti]